MAHTLGDLRIDELSRWRRELVAATDDLARAAGLPWPIESDEATVALARIVAHLAIVAPAAESPLVGHLISAIELDRATRASTITGGWSPSSRRRVSWSGRAR